MLPFTSVWVAFLSSPSPNFNISSGACNTVMFSLQLISIVIFSPALYVPVSGAITFISFISGIVLSNMYGPAFSVSVAVFPALSFTSFTNMYLIPVMFSPIVNSSPGTYSVHSPPSSVLEFVDR